MKPDFFFVGHPRSGSGMLDSLLAGHPDVFMARKELHFFGRDLGYHDPPRTLDNYLSKFDGAGGVHRVGEASTWYLISQDAAGEIKDFAPDAQILMLLRDPVSWIASLHSHLVFSGDEDIEDLAEALAAEPDRRAGRRLPAHSIPALALHYRAHVDYAAQVQRYFTAFGRDRVHIILTDDFKVDPSAVLDGALDFLGLSTDFPGKGGVLNASKRSRNSNRTVYLSALRDFVIHPKRRRVLEGVDAANPLWFNAIRAMRRLNIRFVPRAPMDPTLAAALRQELAPEVEALQALLGRDLSAWLP